jgi:pimeloyl-ACP methyl ester carboxylesterase
VKYYVDGLWPSIFLVWRLFVLFNDFKEQRSNMRNTLKITWKLAVQIGSGCLMVLLLGCQVGKADGTLDDLKHDFPREFHQILSTSQGDVHYEDLGPGTRGTVVLIHGTTGPMMVWNHTVPALVAAGFRVIRYDLFGRGFSARLMDSPYNMDIYLKQLHDLLMGLNINQPFDIIGSSFGAVLAAAYTNQNSAMIRSFTFIDPAGFLVNKPSAAVLGEIPLIGPFLKGLIADRLVLQQNKRYFVDENPPADYWQYFQAQLKIPGTAASMLSTMRNTPIQNYNKEYQLMGALKKPVQIIWGREDVTYSYSHHTELQSAIPTAKFFTIEHSGHVPQVERPNDVNQILVSSLP